MVLPGNEMEEIKGTYFSAPASAADLKYGYRWHQNNRILRVAQGEIVADRKYRLNNYHQNCSFDYFPRKERENIFRFVVLGDSFTNDIMLHTAWPETLHHLLNSRKESGVDFEVYAFPTDGGGLPNWHATFFGLLEKDFEYDALIVADWGDDLFRKWTIFDSDGENVYYKRAEPSEKPENTDQLKALMRDAEAIYKVKSEEWLDETANDLKNRARQNKTRKIDCGDYKLKTELPPENYEFSRELFVGRYGETRYVMLKEIVDTCKGQGKALIYSCLPTRDGLLHRISTGEKLLAQLQGAGICGHFGMRFFDGYEAFKDIEPQSVVDFYWLRHDGHWNLGASMHYALKLAEWIYRGFLVENI